MKFTEYARKELKIAWVTAFAAVLAGLLVARFWEASVGLTISLLSFVAWIAYILFFRDPDRTVPEDPNLFLSPADGVVKDIELVTALPENAHFGDGNALRIGIFLSVFDVHINRAPFDMEVVSANHKDGKYHDARNPEAIDENESLALYGTVAIDGENYPVVVKQISGAIAKRIVCEAAPGDRLLKGQKYGMIKFGSRTELYVPAKPEFVLLAKIGDRVYAGLTPLLKYQERDGQ